MPSALKREHPALQKLKFLPFLYFLGVIFALLDPDPAYQNQCGSMHSRIHNTGYRHIFIPPQIRSLVKDAKRTSRPNPMQRINADPDPKHCRKPQRNCTFMNSASGEEED
jgi:hypothetical protein